MSKDFDNIYEEYSTGIFGYIYGAVKDYATAEDISQDVFVTYYKKIIEEQLEDIKEPGRYLVKIAHMLILKHFEQQKYRNKIPEKIIADQELQQNEKEYFQILKLAEKFGETEEEREVFILREFHGCSYKEIQQLLKLNKRKAEYRLEQVVKRIDDYVNKHDIKSIEELLDD